MSLIQELKQFGLDNKKTKVYLATLELGEAKVSEIAKKSGIERPTVYDILNKLVRDGMVGFYEKRGIRYFVAENPVTIRRQLQAKEEAFVAILPQLISLYNTSEIKPRIKFYEGVVGVKTIFEDTLTARNRELYSILSVSDLFRIPGHEFMEQYVARRIQAGIKLRVIRSKAKDVQEIWPTDNQSLRELRYAPAKMIFTMTMYMYNDKVSLISSTKENFGIIIESQEFRENMQYLFEALWQISTPYTD